MVIASAPGRVNLIGEHIDYNGFGVLPCCISQRLAVEVTDLVGESLLIRIEHTADPYSYPSYECSGTPKIRGDWTDYIVTVYLTALNFCKSSTSSFRPASVKVSNGVPQAAGLSSSSALIVATALAFQKFFNLEIPDFTSFAIKCENSIGICGGGMDQTCILNAIKGNALKIDFEPTLTFKNVKVPGFFVAAHSLVESRKSDNMKNQFNKRVFECRLSCILLDCENLKDFRTKFPTLKQALNHAELTLPSMISKSDVSLFLESSDLSQLISEPRMLDVFNSSESFVLFPRVKHVLEEADRVDRFILAANQSDLNEMGKIMNQSNSSCDILYDCSCPELRMLTETMLKYGAIGARMTGAGWGGYAIALLEKEDDLKEFIINIEREYYKTSDKTRDIIFIFEPSDSATCE
jgi:N-acetylgalactosamine kinase